jgi:hypothetical protein
MRFRQMLRPYGNVRGRETSPASAIPAISAGQDSEEYPGSGFEESGARDQIRTRDLLIIRQGILLSCL